MLAADSPHRQWQMRDAARREEPGGCGTRWWSIILRRCAWALIGMGVTMIAKPDALPYLESGDLTRVLPHWYADAGPISIYYANRTLLPLKLAFS